MAGKNESYDILYLDFSEAFGRVLHQMLLGKIKSHGVNDNTLKWIEARLTNRKQSLNKQK